MLFRLLFLLFLPLLLAQANTCRAADRQTPVVLAIAKARDAVVNIRTEQIVQRRNSPFSGGGDRGQVGVPAAVDQPPTNHTGCQATQTSDRQQQAS